MRVGVGRVAPRVLVVAALVAVGISTAQAGAATPRELYDGTAPEVAPLAHSVLAAAGVGAPLVIAEPMSGVREGRRLPDPQWTRHGLWSSPPAAGGGGDGVPGSAAVWDPSSESWFATTAGMLVRIDADGGRRVLIDDVQGHDFDVRARAHVAVSREPGDRIVLHRFGGAAVERVVLLEGAGFFDPRLSPAGDAVLVAESRGGGGHVWLVALSDGAAQDLGQGYGATWHPDGRRVVFARITNDGLRVTGADLWQWDLGTGRETRLTRTPGHAETEPAVSPDGRLVAWVDGRTGALLAAALPVAREEVPE